MAFRTLDLRGVARREPLALDRFAQAWGVDCNGQDAVFLRVYGWTPEFLAATIAAAFAGTRQEEITP